MQQDPRAVVFSMARTPGLKPDRPWGQLEPAQLMAYLGHADARTSLMLYTHLTAADLLAPSVLMAGDASKYQLP